MFAIYALSFTNPGSFAFGHMAATQIKSLAQMDIPSANYKYKLIKQSLASEYMSTIERHCRLSPEFHLEENSFPTKEVAANVTELSLLPTVCSTQPTLRKKMKKR